MRLPLATALAAACWTRTAAADDTADRKARAAALVEAASAAQAKGDYPTAIARLREAYDVIPHPELLYNLGQAYRLSDQPWDAIDEYERYLAVEPKGRFASQARQHLARLKKAVAGKTRPVEPPPPPPPPHDEPPPPPPPHDEPPPPPPEPSRVVVTRPVPGWRRPTAITLAVLGAAGVGAGTYFGLRARSISDELTGHDGAWTDELLAKQDQGRTAQTYAIVGWAAGGAALLGGVVLFALDQSARGHREITVAPTATGTTVGLTIAGAL